MATIQAARGYILAASSVLQAHLKVYRQQRYTWLRRPVLERPRKAYMLLPDQGRAEFQLQKPVEEDRKFAKDAIEEDTEAKK